MGLMTWGEIQDLRAAGRCIYCGAAMYCLDHLERWLPPMLIPAVLVPIEPVPMPKPVRWNRGRATS